MIAADESVWETLGNAGIYAAVAGILVMVLKAAFDAVATRAQQRRERYAEMVAALVSWGELPFRIRRRTSDEPAAIAALVEQIHQLQERLVLHGAELASESHWLSERYDQTLIDVKAATAPFLSEAWKSPPITNLENMNLDGWGPVGCGQIVRSWRSELRWRFGWRRLITPLRLLAQSVKRSRSAPSPKADTTGADGQPATDQPGNGER